MDVGRSDPHGRGPHVAAVLLLRMLHDLREWDDAGRPTAQALQVWAGVCDLVFRFRLTGPYEPPARGARRVLARGINRVCWLLLRASGPVEAFGPLSELSLRGDYSLPAFLLSPSDRVPAFRAVRLSWLRRLFETLRWLYSLLSDVAETPSISAASLNPSVEAAIAELDRYARVLPRRLPLAVPPEPFAAVSARLMRAGPFSV